MGVKILSLYDGMACGMIAMLLAGVPVESYDAYEIDKYAIKVATHNFPNIKEHGDVFEADFTQYEGVDFLVGGSPCTYWSIAQTKNRETVASGMGWEMFSQYVRALKESKPKYFIYENNKSMSKQIRESIDDAFGFEAICINSALVSAQNRQRLYWVGKRNADGTYSRVNVEQPADRGILLKDVLDSAVARDLTCNDKSYTLTASYDGACAWNTLERHQRNMVAEPINSTRDGKAQCLRATCYKDGIRNIVANEVDKKTGVAEPINATASGKAKTISASYAYKGDGEGSLKSELFPDNPIKQTSNYVAEPTDKGEKEKTIYEVLDGKITIKGKQYPIKLKDGYYIIRKLTVSECKRLQTVPEWYDFSVISNSQAFKCLGNGWTCEIICHLINSCFKPADALPGQMCLWG